MSHCTCSCFCWEVQSPMCRLSNNLFRFSSKIASVGISHKRPLQLHKNKSLPFGPGHFWEVWQYYFVFYWLATKALCLYWYFEKGYQKKCMWQCRKVLCAVLSSLFYKEIFKNGSGGHGLMFASAKGKQQ